MSRAPILVAVAYGAWVVVCILITVLGVGDGGVSAHLGLLFTGLPASLLSLFLPHGTLVGVLAGGVLGLIQWVVVAQYASRWLTRRGASGGA